MAKKSFRLQAKKLFLTFPRTPENLSCRDLLLYYSAFLSNLSLEKYFIAKELHKDGKPHLHAIFFLEKKANIQTANYLDYPFEKEDGTTEMLHGNYSAIRRVQASLKYLQKDFLEIETNMIIDQNGKVIKDVFWSEVLRLAKAGKQKQAYNLIEVHDPKIALLQEESIKFQIAKKANSVHPAPKKKVFPFESFNLSPLFVAFCWAIIELRLYEEYTIVFWGPSASAKTSFIEAWAEFNLWEILNMDYEEAIKIIDENYPDGKIRHLWFDDMDFEKAWTNYKRAINIVDVKKGGYVQRRYGPLKLPGGNLGRIITTNEYPQQFTYFKNPVTKKKEPSRAVERRMFFVYVGDPLAENEDWDLNEKIKYENHPYFLDTYMNDLKAETARKLKKALGIWQKKAQEESNENYEEKVEKLRLALQFLNLQELLPAPKKTAKLLSQNLLAIEKPESSLENDVFFTSSDENTTTASTQTFTENTETAIPFLPPKPKKTWSVKQRESFERRKKEKSKKKSIKKG